MSPELAVIGVVAAGVAVYGFFFRVSPSRLWNPLKAAFALTTAFAIYAGAAVLGYAIPTHSIGTLHEIRQVGHVVWPQAEFGLAFGMLSLPMWWLGLHQLGRR